ncbi:hypothetical protein M427DRAFT_55409 [Gonapodya prolifera JEL478]|uniref:Uncharacterized protein n=1 Tax=Gonapodya prolifera (strain JEL478) TaxID=1344416 RepID=A0A139AI50_GONPJ|nr:hypothetical protein M427DRAFT_55409 [Gonapodya prolifera JEL478]|eukprot:KXS16450.1 hypothetical protein M427DRAFT_55409 [Gonapodya prolifera JEL478]
MSISMLTTAGMFQWWCSELSGVRVLPRLCGPFLNPSRSFTDPLSAYMVTALNLGFIALHVYYLWDYFREAVQGSAILSGTKKSPARAAVTTQTTAQNNRLAATLTLFASSILVMFADIALVLVRTALSSDPFLFFLAIFGGQIVSDIIYCAYMRRFANALLQEKESQSIAASTVYAPPSAHISDRDDMRGVRGPDYVSIDGTRVDFNSLQYSDTKSIPVEMQSPYSKHHSDRYVGRYC